MNDDQIIKRAEEAAEEDISKNQKNKKPNATSLFINDQYIAEEIFDPLVDKPQFAVWNGTDVEYKDELVEDGKVIKPTADNSVLKGLVKLPTKAEEYGSESNLLAEIRSFIHRYVDIDQSWEVWASYYVLLSWVYDKLPVIPYLCALGPSDSGKTRLAQVVGSICYKPFFCSGSVTASPIFRILDAFHGTLIINEFDIIGELNSEIIVILNNGFEQGLPVVRTEGEKTKEVKVFNVFGPKIFASRKRKDDWAFESRLLTIPMRETSRRDIPPFLVDDFRNEAEVLRNKLLKFRFKHLREPVNIRVELFPNLKGRLRQTLLALTSVVKDETFLKSAEEFGKNLAKQLKSTRGLDLDAFTFQALQNFFDDGEKLPTVKTVTEEVKNLAGLDRLTPRTIGAILRDELGFEPKRSGSGGNYTVFLTEADLERLRARYGPDSSSESSVSSDAGTHKTEHTERTELPADGNVDLSGLSNNSLIEVYEECKSSLANNAGLAQEEILKKLGVLKKEGQRREMVYFLDDPGQLNLLQSIFGKETTWMEEKPKG